MTNQPRIRVVRTEMDFTHEGNTLIAVHPFYGPASSLSLQGQIRADGLVEPGMPKVISFVNEYFKGKEPEAKDVAQIINTGCFLAFTGILGNPETRLVTFTERPVFNYGSVIDRDNLLQRVSDGDLYSSCSLDDVRGGEIGWEKVAKNKYLCALFGEEGVEKLAKLASLRPAKGVYLFVQDFSNLKEPIAAAPMLNFDRDSGRLVVHGYDVDGCYAFGVRRVSASAEAPSAPGNVSVARM